MDYKNTLNLPKTDFAMKANLSQREPQILAKWQDQQLYNLVRKKSKGKTKYILHDGPPYANGDIHIGHALNKILKDIVVSFKVMKGYDSPYIPGWDCHGLPVEHQLFKELGINKSQIKQLDFRKKACDYAMRFVNIQREQFKRLGVLGDWDNPYLTLNKQYEEATVKSFAELYKKGYIYRGLKPVNWCFRCETALAEAEVEYEDHVSPSIYVKFEILKPEGKLKELSANKKIYALVWTTTPWTLISNVAIAVHPDFKYALLETRGEVWLMQEDLVSALMQNLAIKDYKIIGNILGKNLENIAYGDIFQPPRRRDLKFILADYVSKEEGTGCVHTAPGHGQEDYLSGQRYKLETVMPVNNKGEFYQDIAAEFKGLHVFSANKNIINKLKKQGNLLYAHDFSHTYPHCWRCKSPIIFRATRQWFMSLDKNDLRKKLLEAIEKKISWVPAVGKERISAMVELRPDWCLSRQRYWGVPIPGIICNKCKGEEFLAQEIIEKFAALVAKEGTDCWFSRDIKDFLPKDLKCPHCGYIGNDFSKGQDILDVWFDSGVSYAAVLKTKDGFFPADLYLEGSDQHRGWFQSSLIPSVAIEGKPPYKSVLTHGFVVDGEGRKMSKSVGNVISPHDVIKDYGADLLRLWVASSDYNEDIRISKEILERLIEAYRKIRNTFRFLLGNLSDFNPQKDALDFDQLLELDQWALSRVAGLLNEANQSYERFEFYKVIQKAYNFCTLDLSAIYLDILKDRLYTFKSNSLERRSAQTAIFEILNILDKILAPVLAFTCDEVFEYMPKKEIDYDLKSVHLAQWPDMGLINKWLNNNLETRYAQIFKIRDLVMKALEEERSKGKIGSSQEAQILLATTDQARYNLLNEFLGNLAALFIVSEVKLEKMDKLKDLPKLENYNDLKITVLAAEGKKCSRCWNYSETVGTDKEHPDLCARCFDIFKGGNK